MLSPLIQNPFFTLFLSLQKSRHNTAVHLYDIQESGKYILAFTQNLSLANYCENELIKAAVERNFAIIGEALVRIRQDDPAVLTRLSDSEKS